MNFLSIFQKQRIPFSDRNLSPKLNGYERNINQLVQETKLEMEALISLQPNMTNGQLEKLLMLGLIKEECTRLLGLLRTETSSDLYITNSLFIHRCFALLNQNENEHLFYVTGIKIGNLLTLDTICEFKVKSASRTHASGDIRSTHITLINLDNYGHLLHALFHKHPGTGIGATTPSRTDMDTQGRMEKGGYPVIGAVFSEDGFIRFFSSHRFFEIKVYGEGVQHVEGNVFKINKILEIPD